MERSSRTDAGTLAKETCRRNYRERRTAINLHEYNLAQFDDRNGGKATIGWVDFMARRMPGMRACPYVGADTRRRVPHTLY